MSDIFISYSRKDSEQALQLAELLTSAGLSCWLDNQSLTPAESWSREIVSAINGCRVMIVLISASSVGSHNVVKEVSLASEKRKKILPLDLEPVALSEDLEYQLAGIQRSSMSNIDSIIRALAKIGLEATGAPVAPLIVKTKDSRKSLMILPFEDLSPTGDNGWFTDGMASELTSALSNVKALRVIDWNTSKEFKNRHVRTTLLAKELEVRYFLEGQVRKFGDQIKIAVTLLDIETSDHLWQDSLKGTMEDIFDIQEQVAERVVKGLKIHLATDEEKLLQERGTKNSQAYEWYLGAGQYFERSTREGFEKAATQYREALKLDPEFAEAAEQLAATLRILYQTYDRRNALIEEAESLVKRSIEIKPQLSSTYGTLSTIYRLQGRLSEAEEAVKECVRRAPEDSWSHHKHGIFYSRTGNTKLAIASYEMSLELKPDNLIAYINLLMACNQDHDIVRTKTWATRALPHFERRLRLVPDDDYNRVAYAEILQFAGQPDAAFNALEPLLHKQDLDPLSAYNICCGYCSLGATGQAMIALVRATDGGFSSIEHLRTDPDLDPLRELPEFKKLMQQLEEKLANV